jgi:hypothetical protein
MIAEVDVEITLISLVVVLYTASPPLLDQELMLKGSDHNSGPNSNPCDLSNINPTGGSTCPLPGLYTGRVPWAS